MKRVACYVRVSTQEQKNHGQSVDSQITALKAYCKDKGYICAGIYNDAGISARKSYKKRPALLQLMADCENDKIDLIIFTRLDRWFRNIADYYEVQRVLDAHEVPWRAIWEDYETETSAGIFKVNIMLSIAQAEADRTSEKIKSVNEYRRSKGQYINGKAPTGYTVKNSAIFIDETKREAVNAFFKEYLNSFNISHAVRALQAHGVHINYSTGQRMLKNPTYYGDAYGIPCEAYITKEQYDTIQKSLQSNRVRQPKNDKGRVYLFTGGILRCSCCGNIMSGSVRSMPSGKNIIQYKFYRCRTSSDLNCSNTHSISEMKIERYLVDNIEEEIERFNYALDSEKQEAVDYSKKIQELKNKLKRIGDRYEDGDISREEYKQKREMIISEIAGYEAPAPQKKEIALPQDWKETYQSLNESHRRAFWYSVVSQINYSDDGSLTIIF